jgi:hypothetical protein
MRMRLDAWLYLIHGPDMIAAAYQKVSSTPSELLVTSEAKHVQAGGKSFEVPGPDHSHLFFSSKEHFDDVRKAGHDELSMFGATKQVSNDCS